MPPAKKSPKPARAARSTPVSAVRHRDSRANIPTEELRNFVAEYEKSPKTMPPILTFCHWV